MGAASSHHSREPRQSPRQAPPKKQFTAVVVGLDGSGKTSIINRLKDSRTLKLPRTKSTIGQSRPIFERLWEMGGLPKVRELWDSYYWQGDAFIFVVSATDGSRMLEAREALHQIIKEKEKTQTRSRSRDKTQTHDRHRSLDHGHYKNWDWDQGRRTWQSRDVRDGEKNRDKAREREKDRYMKDGALIVLVNKSEALLPYHINGNKLKRNPSKRVARMVSGPGSDRYTTLASNSTSTYDTAPVEFVSAVLDVGKAGFRTWAVKPVSALTGEGLEEALEWLSENTPMPHIARNVLSRRMTTRRSMDSRW